MIDAEYVWELEEACRKALSAIAPCVVGWEAGTMPVWAKKLNDVVPDLQRVLGIVPRWPIS